MGGACSVFNAVLQDSHITKFVAVMHPVGHNPHLYNEIKQPTYLVFDVDDPGHPVSVGRLMRAALPAPHYYEHSSRAEPYYHEENMARDMLSMFAQYPQGCQGLEDAAQPMLGRPAGGWKS